jgi:uncharacterized DUF497 family protein
MVYLKRLSGFDWNHGNERKSVEKHEVTQAEAEQIFFNEPLLLVGDTKHSQSEQRFHALGVTDSERKLHITFTLRHDDSQIRVISARDMSRKERVHYEKSA